MILKSLFKKNYISSILIIFCIQFSLAHDLKQRRYNWSTSPILMNNNTHYSTNQHTTIYVEADTLEMFYPDNIQLFGNVNIKQDNNIITSDKLTIFKNKNNNSAYTLLYADGNVRYHNYEILLTGSFAQFNLNNKNIDIYKGTYYLYKPHIYGTANTIMQRQNNHYTIIKKGDFTACVSDNNYWKIIGSKMLYDHNKSNICICNAYLKIKKIPVFYSPYLLFSLDKENILKSYIPNAQYTSKYGLILKVPVPLFFSKYYSGSLAPCYTSNFGITLQTKIHYSIKPGTGLLTLDIIKNNKKYNDYYLIKPYKLYWKHNGIMNKKWHFNIDYISNNNLDYSKKISEDPVNIFNNYINQKFLCYYTNNRWKASIAYLGTSNIYKNDITENHCIYTAKPQLELSLYPNFIQQKLFNFQIFNQFTKFVPLNYIYPKSIRIHTEPIINFTVNNYWGKFNAETKLRITHYQQNHIEHYNKKIHEKYHLQNKVNRIIPQFKINGKMFFQKKTNVIKQYKHFLEPTLQYLYIPYSFQENIGIYDTKMIHLHHNNLFHGTLYSGLDRIAPANQIIGNIVIRCVNKKTELFYVSISQIFNLTKYQNIINDKNIKEYLYTFTLTPSNPNIKLFSSGVGHWNINNYWNIHTEIQHDTLNNELFFGNASLEYIGKKNQIFQTNYRYINAQYFKKKFINHNKSIYYQTISQIGIIVYCPLIKDWRISYSHYHNIKSCYLIDQAIGIQNITPCWIFSALFERKIIDWNNKIHANVYDKKILLNFNLCNPKSNCQSNPYKFLNSNMIPYRHMF